MVVEAKVARTGPAIRQALQDVAPGEAETFAGEYGAALRGAAASLDVSEAEEVLTRWWEVAYLRLNPPTEEEREFVRRLEAGEDVGWASPQDWLAANRR
jgi:hypothetical protein